MQLSPTFNRVRFVWLCVAALVLVALCLWLAGCFPSAPGIPSGGAAGSGTGASGLATAKQDFIDHLSRIQDWCFWLGLAAIALALIPYTAVFFSLRNAAVPFAVSTSIAFLKPFVAAFYWVFAGLVLVGIGILAWPYIQAAYRWVNERFRGIPVPAAKRTTGIVENLKTLVMPRAMARKSGRSVVVRPGVRNAGPVSTDGGDGVSSPPTGGGAS